MAKPALQLKGLAEMVADMRKFHRLLKASKSKVVGSVAADARNIIAERTLRGKDVEGAGFTPYSTKPIYVSQTHRPAPQGGRRTTKSGKPMKTVFYEGGYAEFSRSTKIGSGVNLFATGSMFRAMQTVAKSPTRYLVAFNRTTEALKAMVNNAERRFFGINSITELPILERRFANGVEKLLKRAAL